MEGTININGPYIYYVLQHSVQSVQKKNIYFTEKNTCLIYRNDTYDIQWIRYEDAKMQYTLYWTYIKYTVHS